MKKKVLAGMLAAMMVVGLTACGGSKEAASTDSQETTEATDTADDAAAEDTAKEDTAKEGGIHIGCAVQTLSNQVWAQQMEEITSRAKADGNEVTVVDCDENANTQIDQIENFITSGVDAIIVQPVDADALEDICKEALDQGITVVCWDEEMENSSFNWVIENYDLGKEIGSQAADWINEKFDNGEVEVAVLGYPQTPILLERENGILDALKEKAPNATVVANQPAIDTTEGLNAMETILQANPDVKVVCTIGGGGAAGANEAFKGFYGSEVPDEVGIFSTDLTDEAVASMQNGEFNRMVVAITGNSYKCGDTVYDLTISYENGEQLDHNVYRDLIPVTIDNLDEMIAK